MRRLLVPALLLVLAALAATAPLSLDTVHAAPPAAPTFNKDILPILQKNCQECHRPGAIAPMSFMTYKDARPYARAIAKAVASKTMPPWFADPTIGHFENAKVLSETEIAAIAAWAEKGAVEGDAKDRPAPVDFHDGWTIGQPDIVVTMPKEVDIPATGVIDQSNVLVRARFDKDVWVKAAEVRPGNARVVHHMKAWIRPPNSAWMKDAPEGVLYNPPRGSANFDSAAPQPPPLSATGYMPVQDILAKYNPGVEGQEFTTGNAAKFIAAGSDIVFEVHYTATGKPETDRSSVGIVLTDGPPRQRHLTTTAISARDFEIPAGAPNHEVRGETIVNEPAKLVWVQPHMHYRARNYELTVVYPSGEEKTVLRVPNYRFDWQVGYELAEPLDLPKGTRFKTVAHYDNSPANKFNPDPTKNVKYGAQSWDEMHVTFVGILIDAKTNPSRTFGGGGRRPAPQPAQE
jgi:mono/diheme cytochrome c family protein